MISKDFLADIITLGSIFERLPNDIIKIVTQTCETRNAISFHLFWERLSESNTMFQSSL